MVKRKTGKQLDLEIATFLATSPAVVERADPETSLGRGAERTAHGFSELNKAISEMGPTPLLARIDQPERVNADAQAALGELRQWLAGGGFQPKWDRYPRGTERYRRKFGGVGGPVKASVAATASTSKGGRPSRRLSAERRTADAGIGDKQPKTLVRFKPCFKPSTQEQYDEKFDMLPPLGVTGNGYLVGEPWSHRVCHVTGHYSPTFPAMVKRNGKYFASCEGITVAEWRALDLAQLQVV